jgi:dihydrodipicolinate synthase/N-acetylneuraminate lyase
VPAGEPVEVIHGALAAAVTPLRAGGERLDEEAFGSLVARYADGGLDGILALGTTGEGILLSRPERMRALELFLAAARGRLPVAAHCGAQTTADSAALAEHAAAQGAAAVAAIAPPYYALDQAALLRHFAAVAAACAPTPFYVYEFARASGYAVPIDVLLALRERAPNLAGLKVSDAPFDRFSPYLIEGLDVFVGPEALLPQGLAAGAVGAVSALASTFPELVAAAVREPGSADLAPVRAAIERFPFQAAAKVVLAKRGVPIGPDVRRPLRTLTQEEQRELEQWLESSSPVPVP